MSYSVNATGTRTEVLSVLEREAQASADASPIDVRAFVVDHMAVGTDVARQLLDAVGSDPRDELNVAVYGHATEGHAHSEQSSPETLTVAVQVVRHYVEPPPEPEPETEALEDEPVE